LFASVSEESDMVHWCIFERYVNFDKFIEFLEDLNEINSGKPVVLLLDNLRVHHALLVKEYTERCNM
jgi:transposase